MSDPRLDQLLLSNTVKTQETSNMMLSPFLSSAKVGSSSSFCNETTGAKVGDDYFALNIQLSLS